MAIVMGLALASVAGWNAFLPLVAIAIVGRGGDRLGLRAPYTALSHPLALVVLLVVLLPIELFLDKIPGWDARNDRIGALYRPLAGALIMAAVTQRTALPGVVAALIGAAVAFGMHTLKVRYRRPLASLLAGIVAPVASGAEDFAALFVIVAALFLPVLGFILAVAFALLAAWLGIVLQRRAARAVHESVSIAQP